MKTTLTLLLSLSLMALVGTGCKKTVKGEESRWNSGNKKIDELMTLYPGFKKALRKQRKAAKKLYEAAQSVEDKKAKIKQLSAANNALTGGFVDHLAKADAKIKGIRSQLIEASSAKVKDKAKAQASIDEAKRILTEVDAMLKRGAPHPMAATTIMNKIAGELTAAEGHLRNVIPKRAKPATAKPAKAAGAVPAKKAEPAKWTCEYCNHVNDPAAHSCKNCGAKKPATAKK